MNVAETYKIYVWLKIQMQVIRCKPWKAVNHFGPHCQPINAYINNQ
jgi:hypothetical protein